VIRPKKLPTRVFLEDRVNLDVVDISIAHLVKRHRRLLYFFLNSHTHVWVDSGAAGHIVFAESFV
jgi:hypothetical protein